VRKNKFSAPWPRYTPPKFPPRGLRLYIYPFEQDRDPSGADDHPYDMRYIDEAEVASMLAEINSPYGVSLTPYAAAHEPTAFLTRVRS